MRLILVGGFLGVGKTTAIAAALHYLQSRGQSTAVITNDQGSSLVDTVYLQQTTSNIAQITNGCFCCNYNQLDAVLQEIGQVNPDYIFAEAVGSCTDMVATVVKPLQQQYAQLHTSFTVVADAVVLLRKLLEGNFFFRKEVQYIWQQQLQEADIIVVSKLDLLPQGSQETLLQLMTNAFPGIKTLYQNNLAEGAAQKWLTAIDAFQPAPRLSPDIDYGIYGAGEAALAWLDAELELTGEAAVGSAKKLVQDFHRRIRENNWPIGHLKFLVDTGEANTKISFTEQDKEATIPDLPMSNTVKLIVNARVETGPQELEAVFAAVMNSLAPLGITIALKCLNYFKPGFPVPQQRVMELL